MKTKVHETENPKFRPCTIQIKLETADDLRTLWHMFNMPIDLIQKLSCEGSPVAEITGDLKDIYKTWLVLDNLARSFEMRREDY